MKLLGIDYINKLESSCAKLVSRIKFIRGWLILFKVVGGVLGKEVINIFLQHVFPNFWTLNPQSADVIYMSHSQFKNMIFISIKENTF